MSKTVTINALVPPISLEEDRVQHSRHAFDAKPHDPRTGLMDSMLPSSGLRWAEQRNQCFLARLRARAAPCDNGHQRRGALRHQLAPASPPSRAGPSKQASCQEMASLGRPPAPFTFWASGCLFLRPPAATSFSPPQVWVLGPTLLPLPPCL